MMPLTGLLVASALLAAEGSVLEGTAKGIDGKDVDLAKYKGNVVLIVNTASKCGLTPQYEGLQALHEKYKDQGLVILGFPCNDFGKQEPGTEGEIQAFCKQNYGVSFPLFGKITVKGDEAPAFYKKLTGSEKFGGDIKWNFTKFLINRDGQIVARFEPKEAPDEPKLVEALEAALKQAKP